MSVERKDERKGKSGGRKQRLIREKDLTERERKENEKREKIERGCEGKNERETCQREKGKRM